MPWPLPPTATGPRRGWRWAALGWAVVVAGLLVTPGSGLPAAPPWLVRADLALHFALFTPLAVLVRRAVDARQAAALRPGPVLAALLLATGWGAVTEVLQVVVPGRQAAWDDLAADSLGAVSALLADALATLLRQRFADGGAGGGQGAPVGDVADQAANHRS